MSRSLSSVLRSALYARETGEAVIALITFSHDDLPEPVRICTGGIQEDPLDPDVYITPSRGNDYLFVPVDVLLPEDIADGDPKSSLAIDNVDRDLIDTIRSIEEGATVLLEIVLASDPDTVEIAFPELKMVTADYDRDEIVVDLTIDALLTEPYPGDSFTPAGFPSIFPGLQ